MLLTSDRFDIDEAWSLIARWRITNMFTVPTIVKMLTEHPSVDQHDHSSLRYIIYAGAPMYREDQKHALQKLGKVLVQYFGLGEVTGNITVLPPALHELADGPALSSAPAATSALACKSRSRTSMAVSSAQARREKSASVAWQYSPATTTIRRRMRRHFGTAGSALAISVTSTQRAPVYHRPLLGHVHLGRLECLSARD